MKALPGKLRRKQGFAVLVVIVIVLVVAAGVIYLVHHHHSSSSAPKPKETTVAFDVSTIALIGPNCSYPTPLGCFIPTDSQVETLSKINSEGYLLAHVTGKGYTDSEKVPGTVPHAPAKMTKALHITDISSVKGTGQKQK